MCTNRVIISFVFSLHSLEYKFWNLLCWCGEPLTSAQLPPRPPKCGVCYIPRTLSLCCLHGKHRYCLFTFLSISPFIWTGRNDLVRRVLLSGLDCMWSYHLLSFVWSLGILREMSTVSSNLHFLLFHSFLSFWCFDLCLHHAKAALRKVYKDLLHKPNSLLQLYPHSAPENMETGENSSAFMTPDFLGFPFLSVPAVSALTSTHIHVS